MTTATTRKLVHAIVMGIAGAAGDLSVQLSNPSVSWTRVMFFGLALGTFSRLLGAVMAAVESDTP